MTRRTKTTEANQSSSQLTDKQRVFVAEYVQCWNAAEAARLAGYSEKTARVIGPENLSKPAIREAIDERLKALAMSADEALYRLSEMARSDMNDFVDPNTNELSLYQARKNGKLHLVKKVTHTVSGERESVAVELYDAQAALIQILKQQLPVADEAKVRVDVNLSLLTDDELKRLARG